MASSAHTTFPSDLPVPQDDGAANHLSNLQVPSLSIQATSGEKIDLSSLDGTTVLFCYPRTAAPDEQVPDSWNIIPGARGCTPQACSFRDAFKEFQFLGVSHVFGLSTQDSAYQKEAHDRLQLPYELLSDEALAFQQALSLPTLHWQGKTLVKRMAMIVESGKIIKVFYPVFPPDQNAEQVKNWLKTQSQRSA